jgi:hypothetical protein
LKGDHPRTIPAKLSVIWFSGFRGEDLNVIFYQNMHNRYKSAENHLNFSSETAEPNYTKLGRDGPWVVPFQNCVRQPRPSFKMAAVTKNRNFFNKFSVIWFSGFRGEV